MVQTSIVLLFLLLALSNALLRTSLRKSSRSLLVTRFAAVERVESLTVDPITSINGEVTLPGSKSLSNRVLLLAALAEGTTRVENLLDSADIRYMLGALKALNVPIEVDFEAKTAIVTGRGGAIDNPNEEPIVLDLGNAGTAMRPLAGVLCAGKGQFVLDGTPRMRERPIVDLVDGLKQLGVDVECSESGCPPVLINAKGVKAGSCSISGQISSQYLSALLMMGPLAQGEVQLKIKDELMSAPYVMMTMNLMRKFGAHSTSEEGDLLFRVQGNKDKDAKHDKEGGSKGYKSPGTFFIEGDASSASYFLAGAAITGGTVTVHGCGSESVQGDARFAQVLGKMGCVVNMQPTAITVTGPVPRSQGGPGLQGVDEDCGDIPDAAMTLAVVGIFASGRTAIRNVYNWRVKETERMAAMVAELTKLGATCEEGRDYLIVDGLKEGQQLNSGVDVETYDDHRVAMCFSLAACGGVPVNILDPGCTSKTFPGFFDTLNGLKR